MKRSNGMLFLVLAMTIISLMCLTLGTTYAYLIQTSNNIVNTTVTTSSMDFDVTYNYANTTVYVASDESGLDSDDFGSVKVKNKSVYTSYMTLSLSYAKDDLPEGKTIDTLGTFEMIPMEYVKVAVFGQDGSGALTQLTEPTIVSENPIVEGDTNYQAAKYKIYDNTLASGKYKTYFVKVWLDESIRSDSNFELYDSALLYLKLDVNLTPLKSNLNASLSGTINYNDTPVEAQIVNTTSNLAVTSSSTGEFTLPGFYENETYTIRVRYNNNDYYTTAHIKYSDEMTNSITTSESHSGSYQELAQSYYTTVSQIDRLNPIAASSNSNKYTCENCTMPTAYIFGINNDTTIDSLTLNLLDSGVIEIGLG